MAPRTELVGRARELAEVEDHLLRGAPLVTVTGTAGVGKTALVRRALERWRMRGASCWFCDLAEAEDLHDLCAAVASTLDFSLSGEDSTPAGVGKLLTSRQGVLALDNVDALVAPAAQAARSWLGAAPELQLLVTSRERLGLTEEQVIELGPLQTPKRLEGALGSEAMRLWLVRARALSPRYTPSAAELPAIVELLGGLDGLPLAIELAAARLTVMGPAEMLARLAERFELLSRRAPATPARHRSLAAAIDISWEQLGASEREALSRCAVFAGSFGFAAAEAVVGGRAVMEHIQSLRERSLLHTAVDEGERRVAMLASIRAYARRRADPPILRDAALRHARYYATEVERLAHKARGPDGRRSAARLDAERDNLLVALERCLGGGAELAIAGGEGAALALRMLSACSPQLWLLPPLSRHMELLDRALSAPGIEEVDATLRARALMTRASVTGRAVSIEARRADLEQAQALAREAEDRRAEARAYRHLGLLHISLGRPEEAEALATRSYELAEALPPDRGDDDVPQGMTRGTLIAAAVHAVAEAVSHQGRPDEARRHQQHALELYREARDVHGALHVHIELLWSNLEAGELESAELHAERARELAEAAVSRWLAIYLSWGLGALEHRRERYLAAERHYFEASTMARAHGDELWEVVNEAYAAATRCERGELADGAMRLREMAARMRLLGALAHFRHVFGAISGAMDAALGRIEDGRAAVATARASVGHEPTPERVVVELATALVDLSESWRARASGDTERASALEAGARAALAEPRSCRSFETHLAARLLERALAGAGRPEPAVVSPSRPRLEVDEPVTRFCVAGSAPVDVGRRPIMRRMLRRLIDERRVAPGASLSLAALAEAAWPKRALSEDVAKNRVHVMIARMRELGLRDVLLSEPDGYRLGEDVEVILTES